MKIHDISPVVSSRIGVFPGDVGFERNTSLDFATGHNLRLSSITTTLHVGAHADSPGHYHRDGEGIATRSLTPYLGRCLVVKANVPRGERIKREHLATDPTKHPSWPVERVLVETGSFPNADQWNSDFASFSPELIEEWAKAGVKLIGIDTPSIDPETSKDLPSHAMVAKYDMSVLEGLVLTNVPPGLYTLVALPLKLDGADASPVRAVLVDDGGKAFGHFPSAD
ncbi:MAG: cyclase family protein [Bdellovibrionota bacterium]